MFAHWREIGLIAAAPALRDPDTAAETLRRLQDSDEAYALVALVGPAGRGGGR